MRVACDVCVDHGLGCVVCDCTWELVMYGL